MPDYYLGIMVRVTEVEGILVARKTVLRISLFLFWLSSSALCWKWNSAQGFDTVSVTMEHKIQYRMHKYHYE